MQQQCSCINYYFPQEAASVISSSLSADSITSTTTSSSDAPAYCSDVQENRDLVSTSVCLLSQLSQLHFQLHHFFHTRGIDTSCLHHCGLVHVNVMAIYLSNKLINPCLRLFRDHLVFKLAIQLIKLVFDLENNFDLVQLAIVSHFYNHYMS